MLYTDTFLEKSIPESSQVMEKERTIKLLNVELRNFRLEDRSLDIKLKTSE